jgi:cytochrome c-type biogenesis protein CcmH/NrfF
MLRTISRICVGLLAVSGYAVADLPDGERPDRVRHIEEQLLAPCCYAESVRVHRSQTAADMRAEIQRAVAAGQSDREILDGYIARYGLRILREPEGARRSWLHGVLFAVLTGGILGVVLVLRRMRKKALAAPPVYRGSVALPDEDLW